MTRLLLWQAVAAAALAQPPEELSAQAQQLAQSPRYAEAEKLWRQALSSHPGYFPALFNLGYKSAGWTFDERQGCASRRKKFFWKNSFAAYPWVKRQVNRPSLA